MATPYGCTPFVFVRTQRHCLLVVGTRPWWRRAELFEPHVDEFLGPVDVACGSLQVDIVPFPAIAFDVVFNLPQQHFLKTKW